MTTRRNDHDAFPMTVDQEVADYLAGTLHPELYRCSKLARYLLPIIGEEDAKSARASILQARGHETRMAAGRPHG